MKRLSSKADDFVDVRRSFFAPTMTRFPLIRGEGEGGGAGGTGGGTGGAGGGGTGGGDEWTPPDLNDARVKKWYEEQTKPLITNRDTIKNEKKQLEQQFRDFKSKLDPFGGDVDKAAEMLSKIEDEELKSLLKDGKIDDFRAKIKTGVDAQYKRTIDDYEKRVKDFGSKESAYVDKIKELTIDRKITELAAKAAVHPTAIPDLVRRARDVFNLDENYQVVAIDPDTKLPKPAPSGSGNLTPENWIEALKEDAPHFFPTSSGTGTGGGGGKDGAGNKVIRLKEGYTQSEFERAEAEAKKTGARLLMPGQK